jgi:hypothetical protein
MCVEISRTQIARLVSEAVPALAALRGLDTDIAASLLEAVREGR